MRGSIGFDNMIVVVDKMSSGSICGRRQRFEYWSRGQIGSGVGLGGLGD